MNKLLYFSHPLATLAPRDLLLLESLQPSPTDDALEIGTGSGTSLFRMAGSMTTLDGVDVSQSALERLGRALSRGAGKARQIRLFCLDFCEPNAAKQLPIQYSLIFSCDTMEHVPNPQAFLENVCMALRPGGRAFLTFPNEAPDHAHGITYFERRSEIMELIRAAGFDMSQTEIQTLRMNPFAQRIMRLGWQFPRRAAKSMLRRVRGPREAPQTFEATDYFTYADRAEPLAPFINGYCWLLMRLMAMSEPVYHIEPAPDILWDTQVLIRTRRTEKSANVSGQRNPLSLASKGGP